MHYDLLQNCRGRPIRRGLIGKALSNTKSRRNTHSSSSLSLLGEAVFIDKQRMHKWTRHGYEYTASAALCISLWQRMEPLLADFSWGTASLPLILAPTPLILAPPKATADTTSSVCDVPSFVCWHNSYCVTRFSASGVFLFNPFLLIWAN